MFRPDNPLEPPKPDFEEAWQAQVLAMADAMVQAGHFTAQEWAAALGAELRAAADAPDTLQTYYLCALAALERLSADKAQIDRQTQSARKDDWRRAYETTPHGAPVTLPKHD